MSVSRAKTWEKKKTQGRYDGLYKNAYSYVVINQFQMAELPKVCK